MMSMNASLWVAVEAYRSAERKRFNADSAEKDSLAAVAALATEGTDEDRAEYHRLTEEIRSEWEVKREKAGLT